MNLNSLTLIIVAALCLYIVEWIWVAAPDTEDLYHLNDKGNHIQDDIILQQLARKRKW